jgi:hypothetical protein
MNERIRELAQNAGLISSFNAAPHRPDIERFAEMIVKQCGEIAAFGDPRYSAQHNIHKYFGVE